MSCDVAEIALGSSRSVVGGVGVFVGRGFRLERIPFLYYRTGYLLLGSAPRNRSPVSALTRIVSRYGGMGFEVKGNGCVI